MFLFDLEGGDLHSCCVSYALLQPFSFMDYASKCHWPLHDPRGSDRDGKKRHLCIQFTRIHAKQLTFMTRDTGDGTWNWGAGLDWWEQKQVRLGLGGVSKTTIHYKRTNINGSFLFIVAESPNPLTLTLFHNYSSSSINDRVVMYNIEKTDKGLCIWPRVIDHHSLAVRVEEVPWSRMFSSVTLTLSRDSQAFLARETKHQSMSRTTKRSVKCTH